MSSIVLILDQEENLFLKEVSFNYEHENGWSEEKEEKEKEEKGAAGWKEE